LEKLARAYLNAKDFSMAELVLNRSLEVKSDPTTMAQIGVVKMHKNELEEAKSWFKKALDTQGSNSTALVAMAGLYRKFGFQNKLRKIAGKARNRQPASGFSHPFMR
jgi:Tfp pilus assembly protein PilF